MKKRTLNELRQEKEFGYKVPLTNMYVNTEITEINDMSIAQQIKIALENSNLNVVVTPIMFDPNGFIPALGVLVKNDDGSYIRKYTVTVKPNN